MKPNALTDNKRIAKGFTLMETLVAMAVIAILAGVTFFAVASLRDHIRQNRLDGIAQEIYVTAQNRLTGMYTDTRLLELVKDDVAGTGGDLVKVTSACKPTDWDADIAGPYVPLTAMSNMPGSHSFDILMPEGVLNQEIYAHNWIIEYNPEYGYIYGVYYTEAAAGFDPADLSAWYTTGTARKLRDRQQRLGTGTGYYGGIGVLGDKSDITTEALNATIDIINAEELKGVITLKVPPRYAEYAVRIRVTLEGETSHGVWEAVGSCFSGGKGSILTPASDGKYTRTRELLLDSLKTGKGFGQSFPGLLPGEDATLTVTAELGEVKGVAFTPIAADTAEASAGFNSLFERVETINGVTTACVAYGRHLENLSNPDPAIGITAALQTRTIEFAATTEDTLNDVDDSVQWWAETYVDDAGRIREFTPIQNELLDTFDGGAATDEAGNETGFEIAGLTVGQNAALTDAGLFARFGNARGGTLKNVRLVSPDVKGNHAGALSGRLASGVTVENCSAMLALEDYYGKTYETENRLISAAQAAGGLVGVCEGAVSITDSFAALIVKGGTSAYAGGLVGNASGTMTLRTSYSDSYIYGNRVGGLAGGCGAGSVIENCYSAGFSVGRGSFNAGFVPADVSRISNSYTVFTLGEDGSSTTKVATVTGGSLTNTYYVSENLDPAAYAQADLANHLIARGTPVSYTGLQSKTISQGGGIVLTGFDTGSNAARTTAYNLSPGMALSVYPYPVILGTRGVLLHYGDWDFGAFEPGTLVYFEEYQDQAGKLFRGYYGAGKNCLVQELTDGLMLKRDGYALLYLKADQSLAGNQTALLTAGSFSRQAAACTGCSVETTAADGSVSYEEYGFRDLPWDMINGAEFAGSSFYTRVKVELSHGSNVSTSYYYFNPLFAGTVVPVEQEDEPAPTLAATTNNQVLVRSARQLNLFGSYFADYDLADMRQLTFRQELDIDYPSYNWTGAGYSAPVTRQGPIADGQDVSRTFTATYNGQCNIITGPDYISGTYYTGLFGRSSGTIRNVVIAAQAEDGRRAGFTRAPDETNRSAYAGVLCGWNGGTITNCAVCGYTMDLVTYNSAAMDAGGLTGYNNGRISSCSVTMPALRLETNRSNGFVGAFAGINHGRGRIESCYVLATLTAARYTNGTVQVGGFAGSNNGSIAACYSGVSVTLSNIPDGMSDAFAPGGGSVKQCYYLDQGSFKFCGTVYGYNFKTAKKAAPITYDDLQHISLPGFGEAQDSFFRAATSATETAYCFPAVVSDAEKNGQRVHYGDWVSTDIFGRSGIVYWEEETSGTNNGYHFYILDKSGAAYSTLCEAHDDGGVIENFGYGYYVQKGSGLQAAFQNVSTGEVDTGAVNAMETQFAGDDYAFTLYKTTDAFADTATGLYLSDTAAYGTMTLDGTSYYFSPFFGAAISTRSSAFPADVDLQVRSLGQLQLINWNNYSKKANQLVTDNENNYKKYTYLCYPTSTEVATQTMTQSRRNNETAVRSRWVQTHDLRMETTRSFTPIAGASTSTNGGYNAVLYAWFAGSYDGQSYKIQDISVSSNAFTVGLFGVTAGAQVNNVILYTDKGREIRRENTTNKGAYALGGLIGVAYDYATPNGNTITNCAIAGYRIVDNSTNQQQQGEANVGGLIGVANVNLEKCSAVTDIYINCTHNNGHARWGDYIRVGGVAGATQGSLKNCYSGGSIDVSEATLNENRDSSGRKHDDNWTGTVYGEYSTHIYISGIAGSGFAMNYQNFTNSSGLKEGNPALNNCYTYMDFPALQGTIRAISMMASVADRYAQSNVHVSITNCYYLDHSAQIDINQAPSFKLAGSSSIYDLINQNKYYVSMIQGTSVFVNQAYNNGDVSRITTNQQTPLTYEDFMRDSAYGLSTRLGAGLWSYVTVDENGQTGTINGKYSFPGGDAGLDGRNYPFPCIITQKNSSDETVYVHYGRWPKAQGLYADTSFAALDLLIPGEDSCHAGISLYNDFVRQDISSLNNVTIAYVDDEPDADGQVTALRKASSSRVQASPTLNNGSIDLLIVGLTEGNATIYVNDGTHPEVAIQVTITANFNVSATLVDVVKDSGGNVTAVTPSGGEPESYQNEKLYWLLEARNQATDPQLIPLTAANWAVTGGFDSEYDEQEILNVAGTGQVILGLTSARVGTHSNVEVTASGLSGVSSAAYSQVVTGSGSLDVAFTIDLNPMAARIYEYDNGPLLTTLYMQPDDRDTTAYNEAGYFTDKKLTSRITALPEALTQRTGYDFKGFYTLDDQGQKVIFARDNRDDDGNLIIDDLTLCDAGVDVDIYGEWEAKQVTLTLTDEGAGVPYYTTTMTYDTSAAAAMAGYTAKTGIPELSCFGWYDGDICVMTGEGDFTQAARTGTDPYVDETGRWKKTTDVSLTGKVKPYEFTVHLDARGGRAGSEETLTRVFYGTGSLDLSTVTPTRRGYTFTGWTPQINDQAGNAIDAMTGVITGTCSCFDLNTLNLSTTLEASWTANSYTISYVDEHSVAYGAGLLSPTTYLGSDTTLTLPEPAAPSGAKAFTGWKPVDADGDWSLSQHYKGSLSGSSLPMGNVTLQAQWQYYSLTLNAASAGYSRMLSAAEQNGRSVLSGYSTPARNGWEFMGWYAGSTKAINPNGTPAGVISGLSADGTTFTLTGDISLQARWRQTRQVYLLSNRYTNVSEFGVGNNKSAPFTVLLADSGSTKVMTLNGSSLGTVNAVTGDSVYTDAEGTLPAGAYILPENISGGLWTMTVNRRNGSSYTATLANGGRYLDSNNNVLITTDRSNDAQSFTLGESCTQLSYRTTGFFSKNYYLNPAGPSLTTTTTNLNIVKGELTTVYAYEDN